MGGLEDRLRRLEEEAARAGVPGWQEYEAARNRERTRVLLSAFSKMPGRSEQNHALLQGDSEEQRQRDRDVIHRYEKANGVHYDLEVLAEKAKVMLMEVKTGLRS